MAIDKRISYEVQGGVKNYLGKQKEVTAPVKWKSSPDHPETELAYITKAEKDLLVKKDLHGSLKGGVNRGPSGIMSLNGFGSTDPDQNVSGSQMSAAETGNFGGFSGTGVPTEQGGGPALPPGVDRKPSKLAQDIRSAAIAAGAGQRVNPGFFDSRNVISPAELARAKAFSRDRNNLFARQAMRNTRGGGLMDFFTGGGFLGNIIRSLGQRFGLGKTYDQPTYDRSGLSGLPLGGTAAFQNLDIRDKFNRIIDDEDEEDADALAFRLNEFGQSPDFTTSLINEFGQSPDFTTSLIDEFGVKDRGVIDANLGLESIMPNRVGPKDTGFIEVLDTPQSQDDFFLNAVAELTDKQLNYLNSPKGQRDLELLGPKGVFEKRLPLYEDKPLFGSDQEPTTTEEFNEYLRSLGLTQTI